jgi:4-amino-4-deoxy-L-arabinose transferase-like glycosyltransferase
MLQGWRNWTAAIITVFLSVAPRFFHLGIPFERDEGAYAYVADVIQRGGLPYINAFDHKPPLIYYFYYVSFNLFGHTVSSPRILAIFFVAAACLLLLVLVYRLTKNLPAAVFSSLILGMASASPAYLGSSANTELFTLPFLVGGVMLLAQEDPPMYFFPIAGLLFGIGFLVKQPVAVIAAFPLLFHLFCQLRTPVRLLRIAIYFVLGAAFPLGAVMLFFYLRGGFASFWEACFSYNFGYMGQIALSESLSRLYETVSTIAYFDPITWLAGGVGIVLLFKSPIRTYSKAYIVMVVIGSALATAMGKLFYPHYFF